MNKKVSVAIVSLVVVLVAFSTYYGYRLSTERALIWGVKAKQNRRGEVVGYYVTMTVAKTGKYTVFVGHKGEYVDLRAFRIERAFVSLDFPKNITLPYTSDVTVELIVNRTDIYGEVLIHHMKITVR